MILGYELHITTKEKRNMKNVTRIMVIMAMGAMVFAGNVRTTALGGTQYWADDWDYVSIFPQAINDHANVAWYDGSDFTAYCGEGDKVWGLRLSPDGNNLIDLNLGLNNGLGLAFSIDMEKDVDAVWDLAAGKNLAFGNFAFNYNSAGDMGFALAKSHSLLWFDNMFASLDMYDRDAALEVSSMEFGADFFKNADGNLFALGFDYTDAITTEAVAAVAAVEDDTTTADIDETVVGVEGVAEESGTFVFGWTFAHEAQLFDWATLRVGYSKGYDLINQAGVDGGLSAGIGMTWGSWGLDVKVEKEDLDSVLGNPVHYMWGRNGDSVFGSFDLSYTF